MSLYTSLNTGLSALNAQQAALQTIGHNIANANTPGFSRQRVDLLTQIPQDLQFAQLGRGVRVAGVRRIVDQSLELRLQASLASLGSLRLREQTLRQLEGVFNAVSESDLAGSLDRFFAAIEEVAQRPDDVSTRRAALTQAETLAGNLNILTGRIREARNQLDADVGITIQQVNEITAELAELNEAIVKQENGGLDFGAANDLRDRRGLLLQQLAEIVAIKPIETSRGEVNVLAGSEFLVFGDQAFALTTKTSTDRGSVLSVPVLQTTGMELPLLGGRLQGIVDSRDRLLVDFFDDLNELGNRLAFEFNRVHAQGQGLERFQRLTSLRGVSTASVAALPVAVAGTVTGNTSETGFVDRSLAGMADLTGQNVLMLTGPNRLQERRIIAFDSTTGAINFDRPFDAPVAAGDRFQVTSLPFEVVNGSFEVVVTDELTGVQTASRVTVDLDKLNPPGFPADSTLEAIRAQIDAIAGVDARITSDNELEMETTSGSLTFHFANDSSGFLAAMGLNAFFAGTDGTTIAVNPALLENPALLAAARSNTPGDNSNALAMTALRDALVVAEGTMTFEDFYQGVVGALAIDTATAADRLESQQLLFDQLANERQRVSGVNIDEEAVQMITFQRAFQASARFIATIDQLLATLIEGL